jgi:large subunit ribosomal protein L25
MSQETISLNLEPRAVLGKAVKHLRKDGFVPAVIHDHGKESIHVQADYSTIYKVWQEAGKHHPIQITSGSHTYVALIKDADFDPRKNRLTHVVFNAVDKNQKVEAEIPIHPRYDEGNESSPAERNGFIVLSQLDVVEVEAIATMLPDFLEYDAEKLVEVGDHATVADLIIPEGVEILTDASHSIATVYEPSALAAANDAAGGDAEPELPETEEGAVEATPGEEVVAEAEAPKAE